MAGIQLDTSAERNVAGGNAATDLTTSHEEVIADINAAGGTLTQSVQSQFAISAAQQKFAAENGAAQGVEKAVTQQTQTLNQRLTQ
jgi:hypothetical protein